MKVKREYLISIFCFVFLASGLGLIVLIVSLSPTLGNGSGTEVYDAEKIGAGCAGCALLINDAASQICPSTLMLFFVMSVVLGLCS